MLSHSKNIFEYYARLAQKNHLLFYTENDFDVNLQLLKQKNYSHYLKLQAVPIIETEETITIATANPSKDNIKNIHHYFKKEFNQSIELVVISRQSISSLLSKKFSKKLTHDITHKRFDIDPVHSASYSFSLSEKIVLILGILFVISTFFWQPFIAIFIISLFLSIGTVIVMAYKMGLTLRLTRWPQKKIMLSNFSDDALPVYTILIPLLREKKITIFNLIRALDRIDYDKSQLDIKLLIEEDDGETLAIVTAFDLPWYYEVLIVPPGLPRSKPRACNYGLYLAFGEYLAIFDAEDRPDPDQLKQALKCFLENDDKTICIQAPLNFYNYKENLLTKLFTIEFTHWFDYFVPALVYLRAPVPLGGTSNHFKIPALLELGGWDPYIGTEDADIGVRIYRHGYKTNCITSTTYEEANNNFINWFRQRVRWNKGYMQTYLVNMRDPLKMIKEIGLFRFLNFQYFVGGNVFIQIANLPLWLFLIATYFHFLHFDTWIHSKVIFYMTAYNFLIGNLILLGSEFYSTYKRKLYSLLPYVPFKIVYWFLMSFAGYFAIFELPYLIFYLFCQSYLYLI